MSVTEALPSQAELIRLGEAEWFRRKRIAQALSGKRPEAALAASVKARTGRPLTPEHIQAVLDGKARAAARRQAQEGTPDFGG